MREIISKSGGPRWLNQILEGRGVHREMESEGLAEKYRAVIEGRLKMGQGRACSTEAKGVLIHPLNQNVCRLQGTED